MRSRRLSELGVGLGPLPDVPYSQAPGQEDPLMGMLDPAKQAEAIAMMGGQVDEEEDEMLMEEGAPPLEGGVAAATPAAPSAPMSDQIPDEQLAAMQGGAPEDPQVAQVLAALEDPNTPPQVRQQIETMVGLAARRRMAGLNA